VVPLTDPLLTWFNTTTIDESELAEAHVPLCTIALNAVVCVSAPDVCAVVVLLMLVHVVNGATELSHLTTLPVLPDKVNVPLVAPEHIVVPPLTLPPTEVGLIVTVVVEEFAIGHVPL